MKKIPVSLIRVQLRAHGTRPHVLVSASVKYDPSLTKDLVKALIGFTRQVGAIRLVQTAVSVRDYRLERKTENASNRLLGSLMTGLLGQMHCQCVIPIRETNK